MKKLAFLLCAGLLPGAVVAASLERAAMRLFRMP